MTPPMPPGLIRSTAFDRPPLLERWKRAEPARLYGYSLLAAVFVVLAAFGWITEDASTALAGMASALLGVVPATEAIRASVYSPASLAEQRVADATRWADIVTGRDAA